MWDSTTMTLGESLTVSALGISIVMTALVLLAIAIVLFSKGLSIFGDGQQPRVIEINSTQVDDEEDEIYAVLIAAATEEANQSGQNYQVVSIKEL